MARLRSPLVVAILLALVAEALFVIRLSVPHVPVFDETHYVPAARVLRDLAHPINMEHPLLGKALIAGGMMLFGDTPFGWRIVSTVAATIVVVGVFAIVQLGFGRLRASLGAAILVLLNGTVYVQARIAMLDGFMAAFLAMGVALFLWSLQRGGAGRWIACAAAFGLAAACKWAALPWAAGAAATFLWLRLRRPALFPGIGPVAGVAIFAAVAAAAYLASFAPAFFYAREPMTIGELLPFQLAMYDRQTEVLPPHTYQSDWWSWPLLVRPIWYLYEVADGAQRGILLIGNPVVMWGGLAALVACALGYVRSGDARLIVIPLVWAGSLTMFAIVPKSLGFYYYYYPASIVLCVAIAVAFDHWRARAPHWDEAFIAAALVMFLYFFPVYSAQALSGPEAFRRWTWFASWV